MSIVTPKVSCSPCGTQQFGQPVHRSQKCGLQQAAASGESSKSMVGILVEDKRQAAASASSARCVNLETAVGRAQVGCDAVGWQGQAQACPALRLGWTLRAYAREEKQRGQRAAARLNWVRSALTQPVRVVVRKEANIHAVYPAEESGQLPLLG